MSLPLKLLALPCDDGGCGNYRIRQPFEMIKRFTDHDCHIIDTHKDDMLAVAQAIALADVVIGRQGAEEGMRQLRSKPEYKQAKWVLDIDDNIELISPYSEHYSEYGTEEFYDKNSGKWIWKDGESIDLAKNRARVASLTQGMKEVDLVTVTTPKLAEYARKYNKNVAVLPNCVNLERWWKLPLKPNKRLRVGWSGGISHYEDWFAIKDPLNRLMEEYQFTLVMVGSRFEGIVEPQNRHLVESHDWVPFKGHSYRMMCMNLDLAIIPLADLPFNHYKSAVKWYEMSAMGVPSVVSNVTPYKEEAKQEENALTYSNPDQFYQAMSHLLNDTQKRGRIGSSALEWVKTNRDAKECAKLWIDNYKICIS
jgi:glycosyltransferase involved in cell wall biosynthesis